MFIHTDKLVNKKKIIYIVLNVFFGMIRRLGGYIVILAGFVLGVLFLLVLQSPLGVGLLGLCVMVGVLIGVNILSGDDKLSKGEIRRAIGVSCFAVFFGLLAISNKKNRIQ